MSGYCVDSDGVVTPEPVLYGFYTPHSRVIFDCGTEMMTKQEFKQECDINTILIQYTTTGILNHINNLPANFLDLPDMSDFQQSLALISEAESAFSTLPSKVREHFQNDPAKLLAALGDPAQRDYLLEVGIFKTPAAPPVEGLARPGEAVVGRKPSSSGDGSPAGGS